MANVLSNGFVISNIPCRPCKVKNRKGLFHTWITSDDVYVKINRLAKSDMLGRIESQVRDNHIVSGPDEITTVTNTFALVEFEDGSVEKVRVEDIRFLDSRGRFESYSFEEER